MDDAEGHDHWAFQLVTSSQPPRVKRVEWPLTPIDCYILSELERSRLEPAPETDRYSWLRRVTFDLTGLPPSINAISDFVRDRSPGSFETAVDRLLASRAYGERWARHWLDLVGYADQIGTSNNVYAEHAWRYRDYVIDALNADKPFDRFIRESIAGDLLPYESIDERAANLTATGFLVLGDMEIVEADKAKLLVDIVDQQVHKVCKAFLGMTVHCARCHDHKFDPISQRDYYAIAGFFQSTSSVYKTDRGVWSDVISIELPETEADRAARVAAGRKHALNVSQRTAERDRLAAKQQELDARIKEDSNGKVTHETKVELGKQRKQLAGRISQLDREIAHAEFFAPAVPRVHGVRDGESPANMRVTIRGNPRALGEEVPRGFLQVASRLVPTISTSESGRRQLADWIASSDNPLTARVAVNRIWQKLFGAGLVRSVDYFGVRGDSPRHRQLLDYLSRNFMDTGWSQKQLIRTIVLSRAYRMGTTPSERAREVDPDNRLISRMVPRRLDAEAIRDAMLTVSDQLSSSAGGPAIPLEYRENVGNIDPKNVNPPSFSLTKWRPEQAFQRTIYLPVVRSTGQPGPAELRNIFDFTQPAEFAGQRAVTAVPTQALFLINSRVVKTHAKNLADHAAHVKADLDARLEYLWLRALNRPITLEEKRDASAFLSMSGDDGSIELCRALLSSNEFLIRL